MKETATQSIVILLSNSIITNKDDIIPDNANKGEYELEKCWNSLCCIIQKNR